MVQQGKKWAKFSVGYNRHVIFHLQTFAPPSRHSFSRSQLLLIVFHIYSLPSVLVVNANRVDKLHNHGPLPKPRASLYDAGQNQTSDCCW
ncbi:DUF3237 superfamily domain-containing protein [Histoplasma ohiense]|nr:DUF3237 superfamily domain-containing protein [Histoplasma ohiense (nom. inval.)]